MKTSSVSSSCLRLWQAGAQGLRELRVLCVCCHVCCCRTANYKMTGVGVEDLEVSFPWTAYMGHHEGQPLLLPQSTCD